MKKGKDTVIDKNKDSSNEYKWDKKQEIYIPKASPLAYTLFITERKEAMHKEQEKMEDEKKLSVKQMARKIKSEWKHLDSDEKEKYLMIVEKEKKRFDAQRKEMEDKGYFTLTNGMKSNDLKPPEAKVDKRRSTTPAKVVSKKKPMKKK